MGSSSRRANLRFEKGAATMALEWLPFPFQPFLLLRLRLADSFSRYTRRRTRGVCAAIYIAQGRISETVRPIVLKESNEFVNDSGIDSLNEAALVESAPEMVLELNTMLSNCGCIFHASRVG